MLKDLEDTLEAKRQRSGLYRAPTHEEVFMRIAFALDCPRNRCGKLEPNAAQYEAIRVLALWFGMPNGGEDIADQIRFVCDTLSKP